MEIHKSIIIDHKYKLSLTDSYSDYFSKSFEFVNQYYKEDFDRISNTRFESISVEKFYQEYCWAVCTSGFNAKIVSKFFEKLFFSLKPLQKVIASNDKNVNTLDVVVESLSCFNNKRKIKAMIDCAFILGENVEKYSWEEYRNTKLNSPDKLEALPFIGPITCFHLARNIGLLNNVKPDLHLVRMASNWGFNSSQDLCIAIQKQFDLPLGIIDLILWYGASTFGTK